MKSMFLLTACLSLGVLQAAAADPLAPIRPSDYKAPVKVACVGDSITQGNKNSNYPLHLQSLLGAAWEVRNFGHSGFTLLKQGDKSYWKSPRYREALAFKPDVVVIKLGTNDTKPQNWKFKDEFVADYKELVASFQQLESKPRIYVCLPCPVVGNGRWGIKNEGIEEQIPWLKEIAGEMGLGVIDIHSAFDGKDALIPDTVHPNREGNELMAAVIGEALTGSKPGK